MNKSIKKSIDRRYIQTINKKVVLMEVMRLMMMMQRVHLSQYLRDNTPVITNSDWLDDRTVSELSIILCENTILTWAWGRYKDINSCVGMFCCSAGISVIPISVSLPGRRWQGSILLYKRRYSHLILQTMCRLDESLENRENKEFH